MASIPPPGLFPVPAPAPGAEQAELPLREIPGSYGRVPWLASIRDRLDIFWLDGETRFWERRRATYRSTVFRTYVPPSPPAFRSNPVIMLLDQRSFPILFDTTKVYKKDVLTANFMPDTSYFGGYRPCVYLDPSEERHTQHKSFITSVIRSTASKWIPETQKTTDKALAAWEESLSSASSTGVAISSQVAEAALTILIQSLFQLDPLSNGLSPTSYQVWLAPQVLPIASSGISHLLDELILHQIRIPFFFVAYFYNKVTTFYRKYAGDLIDVANKEFGIEREDALHSIAFFVGFNAFGGLNIFLPWIVTYVGQVGGDVQAEMAREVREAVKEEGGLTLGAVKKMVLIRSAVYETLRMNPPVPYQYGVAKEDLEISSHEARFAVKKGEMLGGCLPFASRDPYVFGDDAETFVASRFVGPEGESLLPRVLWANGPANDTATTSNKLCPGVSLVPLIGQVFLATFFLRYDAFTSRAPAANGGTTTHSLVSVKRRATT